MTVGIKTAIVSGAVVLVLWFLFAERAILTPFVLAAMFAYVCNPLVNLLYRRAKLPRTLAIVVIYLVMLGAVVSAGIVLTKRVLSEADELKDYFDSFLEGAKAQALALPDWLRPSVFEFLVSVKKSRIFSPSVIFYVFPGAISRIISFFTFLFAAFYFLREGGSFFEKIIEATPSSYRSDAELLLRKINRVLGRYLRGQLFMVFLVALALFVALSILGVRFALILAIFSGFAEIVPIIGPITATTVAALVTFVGGASHFSLSPLTASGIVVLIYFLLRQFQDYFIAPNVMGRVTNLHPLVVLFAVLAGGHIGGIIGLILAVPIAASIRILITFFFAKAEAKHKKTS